MLCVVLKNKKWLSYAALREGVFFRFCIVPRFQWCQIAINGFATKLVVVFVEKWEVRR